MRMHTTISTTTEMPRIGTPKVWRRQHADGTRPIQWCDGYGAPEASLVLDPTTMDLEDFSHFERRVILGFCLSMDGRFGLSKAASTEAIERWGVRAEDLGLPAADKGELRRALFDGPAEQGFFLPVEDKPRVSRTIALAPTRTLDGDVISSSKARNTYALQRHGLGTVVVPKALRTLSLLRDLFTEAFEALFILYGLNDLERYGGADPTHIHLDGESLVVSDSFLRAWRFDESSLVRGLAQLHEAGLIAFVPAELVERRWFTDADPQIHYLGDCADPTVSAFVVRPIHQVQRFAGRWAA